MTDHMGDFLIEYTGDGCIRFLRRDGYAIDFFAIPPVGGPCAVLVTPEGDVLDYYDTPEQAASAAPVMAVAS